MEGIKEKNELLSEFNQNCGFSKNLSEMTNEGCLSGEEKSSELVFSTEMDERKSETEKGFDKDGNFKEEIEGESDQGGLGGFKDSGGENEGKIEQRKSDMGSVGDRNEGDFEGGDKEGNEWCENENRVGDNDLGGLIKEAKIDESGKFIAVEGNGSNVKKMNEGGKVKEGIEWSEIDNEVGDRDLGGFINEEAKIDVSGKFIVVEGNEDDLEKMKEGGEVEGNKWSEIDNEVGDRDLEGIKDAAENKEKNPEKRSVVEGIEGDFKIIMEGDNDKEVIKWSEIEEAEYYYNLEIKNKWIDKGKKVIEDDEDGWVEHWDDGSGRTEGDDEQQYLNNYEDEKNVNEQYGEVPYWYGNAEGNPVPRKGKERYGEEPHLFGNAIRDSLGLNYESFGTYTNPLRSDGEDCSFFMKTGTCKFGSYCKFNHPLKIKNQAARDTFKLKEEIYHSPGQAECKYYLSSGGCKYGKACRYNHIKGKAAVTPNLELNFLGLPIRVGEKECAYYMKNGSCKYGPNCRFHHPDPTVAGGGDPVSPGRSGISARMLNKTAPFRPVINPPNPSAPPNAGWNGYQAPVYTTPGRNLPIPPALAMNIPATSSFYAHSRSHLIVNEFPERPGQPECKFYMKTGDCKYRSGCKFHHPKTLNITHSKEGLPLRPGQSVCSHFSRFGICKFGPSCKFDHSVTNCTSASSNGSDHGRPIQLSCFADEYGEWEMEQMRSI